MAFENLKDGFRFAGDEIFTALYHTKPFRRFKCKSNCLFKWNQAIRQSGKSTLVHNLIEIVGTKQYPATYVSFDRPTQMAAAASAPENFLSANKNILIIDEVQMVPELFRALKVVVDEARLKDKARANGP